MMRLRPTFGFDGKHDGSFVLTPPHHKTIESQEELRRILARFERQQRKLARRHQHQKRKQ